MRDDVDVDDEVVRVFGDDVLDAIDMVAFRRFLTERDALEATGRELRRRTEALVAEQEALRQELGELEEERVLVWQLTILSPEE